MTDNSDPSQEEKPTEQSQSDNADEKPLAHQGIHELIVNKIRSLIDAGRLSSVDIDSRVCEQLRSFPNDSASIESVFDEFNQCDLTGVVNRSTFFCNWIKDWKSRNSQTSNSTNEEDTKVELSNVDPSGDVTTKHKPGPDSTKLKEILDRTGYQMEVTAGQRKYGGPPPDGPGQPATNSEVFIGKLPREIFEDELIPVCEQAGKIWDLRLMIDPNSGFNKGYCFVTYCQQEDSQKAVELLNGFAIRPGKAIRANGSVANTRLFIGNIPKTKSKDEIQGELGKHVDGAMNVIIYTPADEADKKKNRGFCFVDFDTHKNASVARRKLANRRVRLFNRDIAVEWADPDEEPDDVTMSQVKVLYIRNLTSEVNENDVKEQFASYGSIERVRKVRDYAFVHFDKREDALKAMNALNGKMLGRNAMEISLAKPMSDKRKQAQIKREQRKGYDSSSIEPRMPMNNRQPKPNERVLPTTRPGPSQRPVNGFNSDAFGDFTGPSINRPSRGGSMNRGGMANNSNRGPNRLGNDRGGFSGNRQYNNFNHYPRGGFNQQYRGGFAGNSQTHNNSGSFYNQRNQMTGRFNDAMNNSNPFGAFGGGDNGPSNPNPPNGRSGNIGSNPNYTSIKRIGNHIDDESMAKRPRQDTGSWGVISSPDSIRNQNHSQQQNNNGRWYQEASFNNSQQSSNYSWS